MELGPVEVPRQIARRPGVEIRRRHQRGEATLFVDGAVVGAGVVTGIRGLEALERPVFVADEGAVQGDGVGVVVLIVGPVAEVERALVVDLEEHHRPVGIEQRPERGGEELEVARRLVVERVAGVARHREREGQHRQHHRVAPRRAGLAARVPGDALGDAEVGELGVDVRPGADDGVEPELVREAEEGADVALGVAAPELELSRSDFVDAPRHVGVDEPQAQVADGGEARAPVAGVEPPVMDAARGEGHGLVADTEPARHEVHAAPCSALSRSLVACPAHVRGAP